MEKYRKIDGGTYTGERALFMLTNAVVSEARFCDGESPLKESLNIDIIKCTFDWKYPIWYAKNIEVTDSRFNFTARSGIWYTDNITMHRCVIDAPKTFRKASRITLNSCSLEHADETLWFCKDVKLECVKAKGNYLAMGSENVEVNHLELDGNYFLDGAKNCVVRDSILNSKDAFWNTENVTIINCKIIGEYLGWNSKNLTLINCEISSNQALCYIDGLKLINCKLTDSALCFEYCSKIDATIIDTFESIKNPTSGIIRLNGVKKLIVDANSRANKDEMKIEYLR